MIGVFLILGVSIGVLILVIISYRTNKVKPISSKKKTFQIVLSAGMYDIRLNGRRLTSKSTYEEAMQWLEHNKSNYIKEELVIHEESYEEGTKVS